MLPKRRNLADLAVSLKIRQNPPKATKVKHIISKRYLMVYTVYTNSRRLNKRYSIEQ